MSDTETIEVYAPTEAEKARGKWAVVLELLDDNGVPDPDSHMHIIPTYGKKHWIYFNCWCGAERSAEPGGNGKHYYTHKAEM